ncbi:hypothetical protein MKX01_020418 [Papaver californicum]|nr:hypothetical protein MKX01_020418 [Papaver californicum]
MVYEKGSTQSNLECFLDCTTPVIPSLFLPKISGLSRRFPGLMSLKSVDLSPASWMAVAWYPIYHIPTGRTVRDLSACFLTYHILSSSFQATFKMQQGNLWFSGENGRDQERFMSLLSAADSWLKQLRVQHHDFNYFTGMIRH